MGKLDQLPRAGEALDGAKQRLDRPRFLLSGEDKILAGETIRVFNRGEMKRDFTYVADIVEGVTRVLDGPPAAGGDGEAPFRLYNIGRGEPVPLMDFIGAIEAAVGREAVMELAPMQPGDMVVTWADTTALQRDHGYQPTTSLADGVAAFVDWYRGYHAD